MTELFHVGQICKNKTNRIGKILEVIPNGEGLSYKGQCLEDGSIWESVEPTLVSNSYEDYISETSKKLEEYLNPNLIPQIAECVISAMDKYNTIDNIEFDFVLDKGKMKSKVINTTFKFDPEEGNILVKISKELNNPTIELTQEHYDLVFTFLQTLKTYFNENCISQLRDKIRKYVIADASELIFPLKQISVENIEINDDRKEYPISIKKDVPYIKTKVKGKVKLVPQEENYQGKPIASELFEIHETTGKPFEQIIAEKKALGDPNYRYVSGVMIGKRFKYIFHLDLNVDYTPTKPETLEEIVKLNENKK